MNGHGSDEWRQRFRPFVSHEIGLGAPARCSICVHFIEGYYQPATFWEPAHWEPPICKMQQGPRSEWRVTEEVFEAAQHLSARICPCFEPMAVRCAVCGQPISDPTRHDRWGCDPGLLVESAFMGIDAKLEAQPLCSEACERKWLDKAIGIWRGWACANLVEAVNEVLSD